MWKLSFLHPTLICFSDRGLSWSITALSPMFHQHLSGTSTHTVDLRTRLPLLRLPIVLLLNNEICLSDCLRRRNKQSFNLSACKLIGTVRTRHASQAWKGGITEQKDKPKPYSQSSEPDGTMANANRRIKASPFSNTKLFPGLAPFLTPCASNMKAQDLENIVNAWAVDYTSASAQHNIRAQSVHMERVNY